MSGHAGLNRIVIAGMSSGSGKTMITCGLIRALKRRGLKVSARKCGPDYIDTMFLRTALDVSTGNLDSYFTDGDTLKYLLASSCKDDDITVIEGVMGYYDGMGGVSSYASTYETASLTGSPVILVADASGISVTLSAIIKGLTDYKKDNGIAGILLNRISPGFYERLKGLIEKECGIPVIGYLEKMPDISIGSRHLGLIQPCETDKIQDKLDRLAQAVERTVDLDAVIRIAGEAGKLSEEMPFKLAKVIMSKEADLIRAMAPAIAVARDEAFSFYYDDNIRLLEELGARIRYFSPLKDEGLPEGIRGLILYGGYPENHADTLSENHPMLNSIRKAYDEGIPIIAECGGFMYLCKSLKDSEGNEYKMCGLLPGKVYNEEKLTRFGYMEASALTDGLYGNKGTSFKGHEFHYYDSSDNGCDFAAKKAGNGMEYTCMFHNPRLAAGFPHFYAYSNPAMYLNFLSKV